MAESDAIRLALLEQADAHHAESLRRMETAIITTSQAISKMVVLEERHIETRQALERAFKAIKENADAIAAMEHKAPGWDQSSSWVVRCVLAIVGAVMVIAAKVVFYPAPSAPNQPMPVPPHVAGP